jgi:2-(1,2-epoxy-1,2-dihydrophenyl)acetyl-CoA isomerase
MDTASAVTGKVKLSRDERAWFVTFNNPAAFNAIDAEMTFALDEALEKVRADESDLPLVLQGAGPAFMAGADLTWFQSLVDNQRWDELSASLQVAQGIVLKIAEMSRIVIAAVQGAAVGYGFGLVCVADRVIAGTKARFKLGQPSLGLTIDGGLTYTLPRLVGYRQAMELVLTDSLISAETGQQMGLVSRLVSDAELDSAVTAAVDQVSKGPQSIQNKLLIRRSFPVSLAEQLRSEQERFLDAIRGETFRACLRKFFDRKPL